MRMTLNTPNQSLIDALKKKYTTIEQVKNDPVRGNMGSDMQNAIIGFYGPVQSNNIGSTNGNSNVGASQGMLDYGNSIPNTIVQNGNVWTMNGNNYNSAEAAQRARNAIIGGASNQDGTSFSDYKAPNGKVYKLKSLGNGSVSFLRQDGTTRTGDLSSAINLINENNKNEGVGAAGINNQTNVPTETTPEIPRVNEGSDIKAPKDTSAWTQEDWDNLKRDQKVDALSKSLQKSFGDLSYGNAEFKKLVDENLKTQLLKNAQMQETLKQQKMAVDGEFKLVYDKFTDNQKEALERVDAMEKKWMANFEGIQEQNKKYYTDQNAALDAKLGGEQAGVASALQAKGINEGVIGNAMSQVKEQHLGQYNSLLKNNIEISKGLNDSYLSFFKDVQSERGKRSDDELRLFENKMKVAQDIIAASKDASQNTITNAFKPYEDAANAVITANVNEPGYAAQDQAAIARYVTSSPEERKMLLIAKLGLKDADAYGTMSKFDLALLDAAVKAKDLPTAIQILGKAAIQAQSSGNSSVSSSKIISKVNEIKDKVPPKEPKKDEDSTVPGIESFDQGATDKRLPLSSFILSK